MARVVHLNFSCHRPAYFSNNILPKTPPPHATNSNGTTLGALRINKHTPIIVLHRFTDNSMMSQMESQGQASQPKPSTDSKCPESCLPGESRPIVVAPLLESGVSAAPLSDASIPAANDGTANNTPAANGTTAASNRGNPRGPLTRLLDFLLDDCEREPEHGWQTSDSDDNREETRLWLFTAVQMGIILLLIAWGLAVAFMLTVFVIVVLRWAGIEP